MNSHNRKPLLAGLPADRYVGRLDLMERLYLHAVSGGEPFGIRISSAPGVGTSEMLRQVYDRLFSDQRLVVPFYFALRPEDLTARGAASRYIYQLLLQTIAFRRNEADLIAASPEICELARLAPPAYADWAGQLCRAAFKEGPYNNERVFIRSCLAAPMQVSASGRANVFAIVDDLHTAAALEGGSVFIDELSSVFNNARQPFVLSARRHFPMPDSSAAVMNVSVPERGEAAAVAESMAAAAKVTISDQPRDLIAVQFSGRADLMQMIIRGARDRSRNLESFRDVEQVYVDELVSGRIGARFREIFARAAGDPSVRRAMLQHLYQSIDTEPGSFPLDTFLADAGLSPDDLGRLIRTLETEEIISVEGDRIGVGRDLTLRDYLKLTHNMERGMSSAAAGALLITEAIMRAPQLMSQVYRREAATRIKDLLLSMDMQQAPRSLFDYPAFRDLYRGLSDDEARAGIRDEAETIRLPQIAHAAPIAEYYPAFTQFIEPERAIAGVGFTDRSYREEDRIAWLAAEIDSKLEASAELVRTWIERLEQAAAEAGFSSYRIWLITPEGFTDEAMKVLADKGAAGSSRRQVSLLNEFLAGGPFSGAAAAEYEMVIPIGEDTELVAANSLEEIVRRYDYPAKAVNQMKTALVEACINAAEHGLSPDKKIYQKFAIDPQKVVITVSNRGLRLIDRKEIRGGGDEPAEGRRGWGLKLIRGLMDDVRIESVDDGTRITMTKYHRSEDLSLS